MASTVAQHRHLYPSEQHSVQWSKETLDALEPLLANNPRRFVLFPVRHTAIWRAYKHAVSTFWIADSIDGSKIAEEWQKSWTDSERRVIGTLLILLETAGKTHNKIFYTISTTVKCPEARCFFGFQAMIENIHQEAIATLNSISTMHLYTQEELPLNLSVLDSLDWKLTWMRKQSDDEQALFSEKLLLFLFVQGIFSSSVASVFKWVSDKEVVPSLINTYHRILTDRETHTNFTTLLFYHLKRRPTPKFAENLATEMVEIERSFGEELLRHLDAGIQTYNILHEIECTADGLLTAVGYTPIYSAAKDKGEVDRKITGRLKALYFQQEMSTAYAQVTPSDDTQPFEDLSDF